MCSFRNSSFHSFQDGEGLNTTKVSVLDIFDPLAESGEDEEEEEEIYWSSKKSTSNFSESFYDTHDPFSYMEQQAELANRLEEVKDEEPGLDEPEAAPRLPLRLQRSQLVGVVRPTSYADEKTLLQRQKTKRNYENIVKDFSKATIARKPCIAMDSDVESFIDMVREVRRSFPYSDTRTNPGYVEAAKLEAEYPPDTQVCK